MNIAICEDLTEDRTALEVILRDLLQPGDQLQVFSHGLNLLDVQGNSPFDLIFLDINMPGLSGVEVAEELRGMGSNAIIIFLSQHREFGTEAYEFDVNNYILKPARREKIKELLEKARASLSLRTEHCEIRTLDGLHFLKSYDILYIEAAHSRCCVYTDQGKYVVGQKLGTIFERLERFGFYRPHHSYVVNLRHIKRIKDRHIFLSDTMKVPIGSRKTIGEVRRAIADFRRVHYGL